MKDWQFLGTEIMANLKRRRAKQMPCWSNGHRSALKLSRKLASALVEEYTFATGL